MISDIIVNISYKYTINNFRLCFFFFFLGRRITILARHLHANHQFLIFNNYDEKPDFYCKMTYLTLIN